MQGRDTGLRRSPGWSVVPAANEATRRSCGVRSAVWSTVRGRTRPPVASNSASARLANALAPIASKEIMGSLQLHAGVWQPIFSTEPLSVEKLGIGEIPRDQRFSEQPDRRTVHRFGLGANGQEGLWTEPRVPTPKGSRSLSPWRQASKPGT